VQALQLSLVTTLTTLLLVITFGTPVAYFNARHSYHGKRMIETLIDLPIVLPPAVAGIALLLAFGRRGLLGQYFGILGINIAFTTTAVILAQTFVSSPFYIRQATTSFEDVDPDYERAAHTLGASGAGTFFRVTVPIALNGLVSGALMTWARALGEFGATIIFAGNFQGVTQTMPLAIYSELDIGYRGLPRSHSRPNIVCGYRLRQSAHFEGERRGQRKRIHSRSSAATI
jgi:molybdate transport system permease protein